MANPVMFLCPSCGIVSGFTPSLFYMNTGGVFCVKCRLQMPQVMATPRS